MRPRVAEFIGDKNMGASHFANFVAVCVDVASGAYFLFDELFGLLSRGCSGWLFIESGSQGKLKLEEVSAVAESVKRM